MNGKIKKVQFGVGLIELLVAIAIGLLLMAAISQLYLSNKQAYRAAEAVARLQENGRFALIKLAEDLRMAGFWGCGSGGLEITNNLDPDGTGYNAALHTFGSGIGGSDGATDVVSIEYTTNSGIKVEAPIMVHTSADIHVTQNDILDRGDIVMVCDITHGDIFQITNNATPGANAAKDSVTHSTGGSVEPGNKSTVPCTSGGGNKHCLSQVYQNNARILQPVKIQYSVATGAAGTPALFRTENGGAAMELVEGVENMQIRYGVDTSGDLAVDSYVNATGVTDWEEVMSVRVSLLLRSIEDNITPSAQTYTYDSDGDGTLETITAADSRLHHTFTTTVNLRNRTL